MIRIASLIAPAALALTLAACGSGEDTAADAAGETASAEKPAIIKERQDNFEAIGDAFKAIRSEMEGDAPDFAKIATEATTINTNAQKITDHFPEGTSVDSGADTEALPTIWTKPEEFSAAAEKLVTASAGLMAAAESGDAAAVDAAIKETGGSCKNCHDTFRLDDD